MTVKMVRALPIEVSMIEWDGANDDEVTMFLGTDDWRAPGGVPIHVGTWLYLWDDHVTAATSVVVDSQYEVIK
jgi:hypothetical protein